MTVYFSLIRKAQQQKICIGWLELMSKYWELFGKVWKEKKRTKNTHEDFWAWKLVNWKNFLKGICRTNATWTWRKLKENQSTAVCRLQVLRNSVFKCFSLFAQEKMLCLEKTLTGNEEWSFYCIQNNLQHELNLLKIKHSVFIGIQKEFFIMNCYNLYNVKMTHLNSELEERLPFSHHGNWLVFWLLDNAHPQIATTFKFIRGMSTS